MTRPLTQPPLDEATVMADWQTLMREVMETAKAQVDERLRGLGLLSSSSSVGSTGQQAYPVRVMSQGTPAGISNTINFEGGNVVVSWDQAGGMINVHQVADDTFDLLFFVSNPVVLLPGLQGWLRIGFDCTITAWELTSDIVGTATIDIQSSSYFSFPEFVSICGVQYASRALPTDPLVVTVAGTPPKMPLVDPTNPSITTGQKARSDNLTGWNNSLARGTYLSYQVIDVTLVQKFLMALTIRRDVQGYKGG